MKHFKKLVSLVMMVALFLVPMTTYAAENNYQTSDFDLVNPGEVVDIITDSLNTKHTIMFNKVAEESSEEFGITITDAAENATNKDNTFSIEFYSVQNNELEFDGYLDFDTTGKAVNVATSILSKEDYKDQPFIYIVCGTVVNPDDENYSDNTLFKVKNPFYKGNSPQPVVDKTPPAKPVVNAIGDNQTSVSGSAEKDAKVYILNGSKVLGSTTSKGTFAVNIPKQIAGTTLSIYAVDAAGNKSAVVTVKVLDKTPPAIAVVNAVTSKSKTVTGKAEKGATVTIYNGKKAIGTATVGTNGAFTVKIAVQKKGTKLTVTAKDKAGNTISKTIIVK